MHRASYQNQPKFTIFEPSYLNQITLLIDQKYMLLIA
jgi:hypothetical protein